jgi:hypothetical protein
MHLYRRTICDNDSRSLERLEDADDSSMTYGQLRRQAAAYRQSRRGIELPHTLQRERLRRDTPSTH